MDSTTTDDEPGRSTSQPPADRIDSNDGHRESVLAQMLVARHERLLTSGDLAMCTESSLCFGNEAGADALAAELEELEDCLRLVERARRASALSGDSIHLPLAHGALGNGGRSSPPSADCIGRFEILRELGRGGLGIVMLAYDPVLRRRVALKVPRPEALLTPNLRKRFHHEAQAAARLTHPNIVPVYEVGEAGAICFIAAEYITGPNLAHWLQTHDRPVDPRQAAQLVADLAQAMDHAHRQGVLHRDLKPGNVLLERCATSSSEVDLGGLNSHIARITDFGLARLMDRAGHETRSGAIIGTPAYMAPEQAAGASRQVGPASDVYSLGAVLYELLAGKPPFSGETDSMTLLQVISDEPPSLRHLRPQVPRDLEAICRHAMAKDPKKRYTSAGELAADLERFLAGTPTKARPLSAVQWTMRWSMRKPTQAALVALAITAFAGTLAGTAFHTAQVDRALRQAEANESKAIASETIAQRETGRANLQLYAAHMHMANLAIEREHYGHAGQILSTYDEGTPLVHLRGVEWHVLRAQVDRPDHQRDHEYSVLFQHPDEVYTVRFVPGSELLVTGAQDGHIRFWDRRSRQLTHDLKQHGRCVNKIRFSPDGRWMASASCDQSVILWRMTENGPPEPMHTLTGNAAMRSLEFSPESLELASGDESGLLSFWEPSTGRLIRNRQLAPRVVSDLSWSPLDQRMVVSLYRHVNPDWLQHQGGDDWQELFPIQEWIVAADAAFSPDGKRLAVNERNLRLRQFATDTWQELPTILSEGVRLAGIAWSPNGDSLATAGGAGDLRIYDSHTGKLKNTIDVHNPGIHYEDIVYDASGQLIASAARDGSVFVTDTGQYRPRGPAFRIQAPLGTSSCAQIDGEFDRVSLCSSTGYCEWRIDDGQLVAHQSQPDLAARTQVLATRSNQMIYLENGAAVLHDLKRDQVRIIPSELAANVHQANVLSESIFAVLCGQEPGDFYHNKLRVFDSAKLQQLYWVSCGARPQLALSADRRVLAQSLDGSCVELVDLQSGGHRALQNSGGSVNDLVFSPDGRQLAGTANFTVFLWDTESLTLKQSFQCHSFAAPPAFSPDGRTLAIVSDNALVLMHTQTGGEMVNLSLPSPAASSGSSGHLARTVHFSADGRRIALVSHDELSGTLDVHVWGKLDQ